MILLRKKLGWQWEKILPFNNCDVADLHYRGQICIFLFLCIMKSNLKEKLSELGASLGKEKKWMVW